MRSLPSPASLWRCTAGSVAGNPPPPRTPVPAALPRRINFLAERRRRRCASAIARGRACVRAAAPDVSWSRMLRTYTGGGEPARTHTHSRRGGGTCVRRTSRIWSTDRFRTTPSRPDRPLPFLSPPPASRSRSPFPVRACMHSQNSPRTLATRRAVLSRCVRSPLPLFREIRSLSLSLSLSVAIDILSSRYLAIRASINDAVVCPLYLLRDVRDRLPPSLSFWISPRLIRNETFERCFSNCRRLHRKLA